MIYYVEQPSGLFNPEHGEAERRGADLEVPRIVKEEQE